MTALLEVVGKVGPAQPVLRVVVKVQSPENITGCGFGEDASLFVGGAVNLLGSPDQCDPVRPVVVEQQFGLPAALKHGTEFIEEISDEVFHG